MADLVLDNQIFCVLPNRLGERFWELKWPSSYWITKYLASSYWIWELKWPSSLWITNYLAELALDNQKRDPRGILFYSFSTSSGGRVRAGRGSGFGS